MLFLASFLLDRWPVCGYSLLGLNKLSTKLNIVGLYTCWAGTVLLSQGCQNLLSSLDDRKLFLPVLEAISQKSRCWWDWILLQAVRETLFYSSFLTSSYCWWFSVSFLGFQLNHSDHCLSYCMSLPKSFSPLKDTGHWKRDYPRIVSFYLNLIKFSKILWPREFTFTDSRYTWIWVEHNVK